MFALTRRAVRASTAVPCVLRSVSTAPATWAARAEKRVVMVTGGAKGIGLGVSRSFAANGDIVVALDQDEDAALNLPAGASFMKIDVGSATECEAAVDVVMAQHG